MTVKNKMFQPGKILHEVIVGAFRAQGTSFAEWYRKEGVKVNTASLATYGQAGGDRGQKMLVRMIQDANPAVVKVAHRKRMRRQAKLSWCLSRPIRMTRSLRPIWNWRGGGKK